MICARCAATRGQSRAGPMSSQYIRARRSLHPPFANGGASLRDGARVAAICASADGSCMASSRMACLAHLAPETPSSSAGCPARSWRVSGRASKSRSRGLGRRRHWGPRRAVLLGHAVPLEKQGRAAAIRKWHPVRGKLVPMFAEIAARCAPRVSPSVSARRARCILRLIRDIARAAFRYTECRMALNPGASTIAASPSSMSRSLHAKTPQVEPARSPRSAALLAIEQGGWSAANYCHALGVGGRRSALARCCGRLFCADWSDASGSSPCARARSCRVARFSAMRVLFLSACSGVAAGLFLGDAANRTAANLFPRGQGAAHEESAIEESFHIAYGHFEKRRRALRATRQSAGARRAQLRQKGGCARGGRGSDAWRRCSESGARLAREERPARAIETGLRLWIPRGSPRRSRPRAWIGVTLRSMHQAYSSLLRQLKAGEALYRTASAFTAYAADPSRQRSPARCLAAARADARARRDRRCNPCAGWQAPLRQGRRRRGSPARPARREPRVAPGARQARQLIAPIARRGSQRSRRRVRGERRARRRPCASLSQGGAVNQIFGFDASKRRCARGARGGGAFLLGVAAPTTSANKRRGLLPRGSSSRWRRDRAPPARGIPARALRH